MMDFQRERKENTSSNMKGGSAKMAAELSEAPDSIYMINWVFQ